jgi:hypothetical protein
VHLIRILSLASIIGPFVLWPLRNETLAGSVHIIVGQSVIHRLTCFTATFSIGVLNLNLFFDTLPLSNNFGVVPEIGERQLIIHYSTFSYARVCVS